MGAHRKIKRNFLRMATGEKKPDKTQSLRRNLKAVISYVTGNRKKIEEVGNA